jgi:cytochrome P450
VTEVTDPPVATFSPVRKCPFSPPESYGELREQPTLSKVRFPNGDDVWAVTKLEDARAALLDTTLSSMRSYSGFPTLQTGERVAREGAVPTLVEMDPPMHGPARQAVVGEFTVRRMEALRPRIQQIVDERIDKMLAGEQPVDLMEALALPVPSLVICEQLGVPYEDHDFFQSRSTAILSNEITREERDKNFGELQGYLYNLVVTKEENPTDDLIGRQIVKAREAGAYDRTAMVGMAFLLLLAGHETTANMISLGTVTLLRNPEQLEAIKSDPAKTLSAVEELLRYTTITDTVTMRLAMADVELGGQTIKAGEGVAVLGFAANTDPTAFERPEEFDLERGARHHVAFGFGPHQCLGQNLARLELQIVFDTLFRRIPGLKLAQSVEELRGKEAVVYGIRELLVSW